MTDQAQASPNHDLVSLYAGRVKARYRRPHVTAQQRRSVDGVHTFGRRPAIRQLPISRKRRAITALMATAVFAGSAPAVASNSGTSHEIQPGETLTSISRSHGISIDELIRINSIEDPDTIFAGDLLNIGERFGIDVGDTVYRVKEGDTLFQIANAHEVSLSDLLEFNEIEDQDLIYPGHILVIPTRDQYEAGTAEHDVLEDIDEFSPPAEEPESIETGQVPDEEIASLHLVGRGETLGAIALRYDVSVERLAAANDIENLDEVQMGMMLRIPADPPPVEEVSGDDVDLSVAEVQEPAASTVLEGFPVFQQALPLSCEATALSMATAYFGYQVSDWVFIENMPYHPNPHHGFRGEMNQQYGGTDNYGVYPGPLSAMLANYGFIGDEFYTQGDTSELRHRIDDGQPVLVWIAAPGSDAQPIQETYDNETFTLVPGQHVVVAYGYDEDGIMIADPGAGEYRTLEWDVFVEAWSKFDGMSMAVYPKQ